jgi:hypothetical protein
MEPEEPVAGATPATELPHPEHGEDRDASASGEVSTEVKVVSDVPSKSVSSAAGPEAIKTNTGGFAAMLPPAPKPKGFAPPPPKFPGAPRAASSAPTASAQPVQAPLKPGKVTPPFGACVFIKGTCIPQLGEPEEEVAVQKRSVPPRENLQRYSQVNFRYY